MRANSRPEETYPYVTMIHGHIDSIFLWYHCEDAKQMANIIKFKLKFCHILCF